MAHRDDDGYQASGTSGKAIVSLVLGIASLFCTFLTGLPAVILGLLSLRDIGRSGGQLGGRGLAIGGMVAGVVGSLLCLGIAVPITVGLLVPAVQKVRDAAVSQKSQNNLFQIGMAMHNYEANMGTLPPAGFSGVAAQPGSRPQLSWRVLLLPYLEQDNLYRQFHLDEPWDSQHNLALAQQMPKVYAHPTIQGTEPGMTYYQVVVGQGTMFEPGQRIRLADVLDGVSNTIMVVEAAQPVFWTKPDDLTYDPKGPLPRLADSYSTGHPVVMGDGTVRSIKKTVAEPTLRALFTRAGGEVVFDY